jgi:hypothetical protein
VKGNDFTESSTLFSNLFGPSTSVITAIDQLNFGNSLTYPSSTEQLLLWYKNVTGNDASYQTVASWSSFDILEAALYRSSLLSDNKVNGTILSEVMLTLLHLSQLATPIGRVIFDAYGVNTHAESLFLQELPVSNTAEIVFPTAIRTSEAVYPMPRWNERVYKWSLISDHTVFASVILSAILTVILLTIGITAYIHRKEDDIRMIHSLHIISFCLAAIIICWSLTFLYQSDMTQQQCDSYLWVTYIPASYLVQLNNMKAYRLAVFLRISRTGRRQRPFSHWKVLKRTCLLVLISIVALALSAGFDPPIKTRVVIDINRPSLDEHHCGTGMATPAILYAIVAFHIACSFYCIRSVRNGMEAFRDGVIIKESFILLYACVLIGFILQRLSLSQRTTYMSRTACLGIGVTVFTLRLMISRCIRHWVPNRIKTLHNKFFKPFLKTYIIDSSFGAETSHVSKSLSMDVSENSPVYAKEIPMESNLLELVAVLKDSHKCKILYSQAKQLHAGENVKFLQRVLDFDMEAKRIVVLHSCSASNDLKIVANQIYEEYLTSVAIDEVNVSAAVRSVIEKRLREWKENVPLLTTDTATIALTADYLKRPLIFETAFKEIAILTYQNLWDSFRCAELEDTVLNDEQNAYNKKVKRTSRKSSTEKVLLEVAATRRQSSEVITNRRESVEVGPNSQTILRRLPSNNSRQVVEEKLHSRREDA